jgi:hypothetical protein
MPVVLSSAHKVALLEHGKWRMTYLSRACRDMSAFPFKYPMVFQRKDGALMSMVSYVDAIRNPETKHPTHFIMWLTQFRPFVPANPDSLLQSTPQ